MTKPWTRAQISRVLRSIASQRYGYSAAMDSMGQCKTHPYRLCRCSLPVVTSGPDGTIHHPENREDDSDHDQDQSDRPEDSCIQDHAEDQEDHAENDHRFRLPSRVGGALNARSSAKRRQKSVERGAM